MDEQEWTAVDEYLSDVTLAPDPALAAALRNNAASGLPSIDVSPLQGKFLLMLARMCAARRILEIGTLGGYSTICLARGLAPGGRLITLELNPRHAEVARQNLETAGVADRVEVRVGAALASLQSLADEGQPPFDVIFIDADKISTADYFDWAIRLARPGTVIVVDNVVRDGGVADASSTDQSVIGVRRFFERARGDTRVTMTALQTVGVKGWDGFAIALVNPAT